MGRHWKLRERILAGGSDGNIEFASLCQLLACLGFAERVKGGHHIFSREGIVEIINLQSKGSKAKPYQVKQVRSILVRHRLGESDVD
jgi:hypothetical protein